MFALSDTKFDLDWDSGIFICSELCENLFFCIILKNAKHPCITKKQVICDGGPIGNMEGKNRRMARWQADKKAFKRSKSMFRCDEKASKGASSVGDIMCDFGRPEFVSKVR